MNPRIGQAAILWNVALSILILAVALALWINRPDQIDTSFEGNSGCSKHGGVQKYETGGRTVDDDGFDSKKTKITPSIVFCSDGSFVSVKED